jgi:hypothetical protein
MPFGGKFDYFFENVWVHFQKNYPILNIKKKLNSQNFIHIFEENTANLNSNIKLNLKHQNADLTFSKGNILWRSPYQT